MPLPPKHPRTFQLDKAPLETWITRPTLTISGSSLSRVQLFLPVPVASLKNVTEISALGTTFNQRQFPQRMFVPRSFTGNGVDQFTGHDTPSTAAPAAAECAGEPGRTGPDKLTAAEPAMPTALASGSICSQPSTSHHTPSKGSGLVRQVRGSLTCFGRDAASSSCRHRSGSLARNRSRLSPLGESLTSGDTMDASADCVSRMECSRATGSNRALRSFSMALVSATTASCWITRSQGVAGEL